MWPPEHQMRGIAADSLCRVQGRPIGRCRPPLLPGLADMAATGHPGGSESLSGPCSRFRRRATPHCPKAIVATPPTLPFQPQLAQRGTEFPGARFASLAASQCSLERRQRQTRPLKLDRD